MKFPIGVKAKSLRLKQEVSPTMACSGSPKEPAPADARVDTCF